jgi:hypothetical protein
MLVFGALSMLLLFHMEEFQHHLLHEIIEKLLILSPTLLAPPILIPVVVVLGVESIWEPTHLADTWTVDPFYPLFFLLRRVRGALPTNHELLIANFIRLELWLTIRPFSVERSIIVDNTFKFVHLLHGWGNWLLWDNLIKLCGRSLI